MDVKDVSGRVLVLLSFLFVKLIPPYNSHPHFLFSHPLDPSLSILFAFAINSNNYQQKIIATFNHIQLDEQKEAHTLFFFFFDTLSPLFVSVGWVES